MRFKKIITLLLGIVLFTTSCSFSEPQLNCTLIGEKVALHSEYYVTVNNVDEVDNISILKNANDEEETELTSQSNHFIKVDFTLERYASSDKENHIFDPDDFKLKDHTGVQLGTFNIFSPKDGKVLSSKKFDTRDAIKDHNLIGKSVNPGECKDFTIYFEIEKSYSIDDTVMVVEFDFFIGIGKNKGTDIVLGVREDK